MTALSPDVVADLGRLVAELERRLEQSFAAHDEAIVIKALAGGGGRGMRIVRGADQIDGGQILGVSNAQRARMRTKAGVDFVVEPTLVTKFERCRRSAGEHR